MKFVMVQFPDGIDISSIPEGNVADTSVSVNGIAGSVVMKGTMPNLTAPIITDHGLQHLHVLGADTDPGASTGPAVPS